MNKKPAIRTQLKNLTAELAAQAQEAARLTKELASRDSSLDYARKASAQAEAELEQIHTVLDALPGSIDRKHEDGYSKRAAMTRLAAWFATSSRSLA